MTRVLVRTARPGLFKLVDDPDGRDVRAKPGDKVFDSLDSARKSVKPVEAKTVNSDISNGAKLDQESEAAIKAAAILASSNAVATKSKVTKPKPAAKVKAVKAAKSKEALVDRVVAEKTRIEENGVIISQTGKRLRGKTVTIKCQWKGEDGSKDECGQERIIKTQDAFQVKYCVDHTKEAAKIRERNRRRKKSRGQEG